MNAKFLSVALAIISALGITYFVADILLGLGDIARIYATESMILIIALVVTLVPLAVAWGGVWWVFNAKSMQGIVVKLLASSTVAWAWLFFGSIYLALLRFQ